MKLRLAAALLLLLAQGCAALKFEVPDEFKGKKQIEDPPLSRAPIEGIPSC
jgi:hypothetical protein